MYIIYNINIYILYEFDYSEPNQLSFRDLVNNNDLHWCARARVSSPPALKYILQKISGRRRRRRCTATYGTDARAHDVILPLCKLTDIPTRCCVYRVKPGLRKTRPPPLFSLFTNKLFIFPQTMNKNKNTTKYLFYLTERQYKHNPIQQLILFSDVDSYITTIWCNKKV